MCVYSMIADHYIDKWKECLHYFPYEPTTDPYPYPQFPYVPPVAPTVPIPIPPILPTPLANPLTQEEVDDLRKLLEAAKEYDKKHNQPDCELEDKKKILQELAKKLGVELKL